ncbi:MAG: NfeD family protein [Candidatus Kapabacteria bacterium]|nr:NfeD family protein [Candidatus Kapabacteria bacterium]
MNLTPYQYWLAAAILLFILEIVTPGFVLANFAVAAMAASAAAWLDASFNVQLIVFVVTCLVSFVAIRPLLHKTLMKTSHSTPTGSDAVVGRLARVTDAIPASPDGGRVQVDGDSWRAMSVDGMPIAEGVTVKVVRVDSTVLFVVSVN